MEFNFLNAIISFHSRCMWNDDVLNHLLLLEYTKYYFFNIYGKLLSLSVHL